MPCCARKGRWRSTRRCAESSGARGGGHGASSVTERAALAERIAAFGVALRALDAQRCAGVLTAYRLVATPSLGGEAERGSGGDLLVALGAAQSARGQADAAVRRDLFAGAPALGRGADRSAARCGGRSARLAVRAARAATGDRCAADPDQARRSTRHAGAVRRRATPVEADARRVCRQSGAGLFPAPAPDRRAPPSRRRGGRPVGRRRGAAGGVTPPVRSYAGRNLNARPLMQWRLPVGLRAVVEDMAEMPAAAAAMFLGAGHAERAVVRACGWRWGARRRSSASRCRCQIW